MTVYQLEITVSGSAGGTRKFRLNTPAQVASTLDSHAPTTGVVFVAALGRGVDHGNFYIFRNEAGLAHVVLHEHREFFPRDPLSAKFEENISFRSENGEEFQVPANLTTSWERARSALEHWLPAQARWPEFNWD